MDGWRTFAERKAQELFGPEKARAWWNTPLKELGNKTPEEAWDTSGNYIINYLLDLKK